MKHLFLLLILTACTNLPKQRATQAAEGYPAHWFHELPKDQAFWWEVPPQAALPGEVILSKRNELGLLSNFAKTPFTYKSKSYQSIEGFWQMMKFPERRVEGKSDPRAKYKFPHTRESVSQMIALDAKFAGDAAEKILKEKKIDWVTFEGKKMLYCSIEKGEHYRIIYEVMVEKVRQNKEVRDVLLATGNLKLRPDHIEEGCQAPEWKYYQMWMEIRADLVAGKI